MSRSIIEPARARMTVRLAIAAGLHFALARPNVVYTDLDGHLRGGHRIVPKIPFLLAASKAGLLPVTLLVGFIN